MRLQQRQVQLGVYGEAIEQGLDPRSGLGGGEGVEDLVGLAGLTGVRGKDQHDGLHVNFVDRGFRTANPLRRR
jgi:hypothetical protein